MLCPLCVVVTFTGGMIGSLFGVYPPATIKGKLASIALSGSLTMITATALKIFFRIPFCNEGYYTLKTFARVIGVVLIIGNVYSLGVNYLLNRFVFNTATEKKRCCHTKVFH